MAYKSRYGITPLRNGKVDNLSISWDNFINSSDNFDKPKYAKNRVPVLLFTPWMENTVDHHHISLNKRNAKTLRNWLNDYLKDTGAE